MIKQSSENIKYDSYTQNTDFDDLTIEYKQRLFTKHPIDILNNISVERLKVSSIEMFLDNRIYESNPKNSDFYDLPCDGDEMLIARQQIYCINDDIIFRLINS